MQIPLSFPVFYQSVIKERLTLKQYDAVNLLLLGKRYSECVEIQISQSMLAGRERSARTSLLSCLNARLQNVNVGSKHLAFKISIRVYSV